MTVKDFNVHITNKFGKNALRLAIENERIEVKLMSAYYPEFI